LAPVQKLQYLRTSLKGRAAYCIESLSTTNANYNEAIAILKEKFDHPRYTCLRHWSVIQNYPKVAKESPRALEHLVDRIKQHLCALRNLGEPITSDTVLIGIILSKLSPDIIKQWELTLHNKDMPPYTQLLDFLMNRANCVRASRIYNPLRQGAPRGHVLTSITCPTCRGPHRIWHCLIFKAKSFSERLSDVREAALCTNCLGKGYTPLHCLAGSCLTSGKSHHTLLHRSEPQPKTRPITNGRIFIPEHNQPPRSPSASSRIRKSLAK
jgi:hypothetical protein